jgi:hypothetical protein
MQEGCGLLLTCKQLHVEAIKIFYSKNDFLFEIAKASFDMEHLSYASWLEPRHLANIQHVTIAITTDIPGCTESSRRELVAVFNRLAELVSKFQRCGRKLKTLTVRFRNEFRGQLERIYGLRYKLYKRTGNPPETTLRDIQWSFCTVKKCKDGTLQIRDSPFHRYLPIEWVRILDPLLLLRGQVEYLNIRGDLPQCYLREVKRKVLEGVEISVPILRRTKLEAKLLKDGHLKYEHSKHNHRGMLKETFARLLPKLANITPLKCGCRSNRVSIPTEALVFG